MKLQKQNFKKFILHPLIAQSFEYNLNLYAAVSSGKKSEKLKIQIFHYI